MRVDTNISERVIELLDIAAMLFQGAAFAKFSWISIKQLDKINVCAFSIQIDAVLTKRLFVVAYVRFAFDMRNARHRTHVHLVFE